MTTGARIGALWRARPWARREAARPVMFVHVPRSGGTSLTAHLAASLGRATVVGRAEDFPAALGTPETAPRLITGHFYVHQIPDWAWEAYDVRTVLRDPLARLISSYRYSRMMAAQGGPLTPGMRRAAAMPFHDYVRGPQAAADRHASLYILGLRRGDPARRITPEALFHAACATLERVRCDVTEDFGDAVGRLNVTAPEGFEAEARADAELREALRWDYALYDRARALAGGGAA